MKAWGEIGLDFNRMYSPRPDQERWFSKQLEAADEINLPVIFHERDSQGRFLQILKAHTDRTRKGVVHCFSGNAEELEQYLDLGLYIGITGIVTRILKNWPISFGIILAGYTILNSSLDSCYWFQVSGVRGHS